MSLLRAAARTALASFFVVQGAKAIKDPEPLMTDAQPLADKYVPLAQKVAPVSVAPYIPTDTKTLVRLNGALGVLGGLGLATGLGRRLGAAMVSASMLPHVLAANPRAAVTPEQKAVRRAQLSRNVALLGGAVLAALDTQGKPSLAWRAADQKRRLAREAAQTRKSIAASAEGIKKDAAQQAKALKKSDFAKEAKALRKEAAKQAKAFKKDATKQAKRARASIEGALS